MDSYLHNQSNDRGSLCGVDTNWVDSPPGDVAIGLFDMIAVEQLDVRWA